MRYRRFIGLCVAVALLAAGAGCSTIPTGRTGVEWTPTQGTREHSLGEGFHLVSPFSRIYQVDLREQEREEELDVLANNGLDIKMTSSILYEPVDSEVTQLIRQTGPEYYATLIAPYVRSSARRVVGRYSPEEIYSTKREQIEREIRDEVERKLQGQHVMVSAILIREVHLPPVVQSAIQAKLQEEQRALEMRFVLDRTRQEAERKRIEASGIADYQATISKGLNDKIIAWKSVEAIDRLANSSNAKVVVLGTGKSAVPLILNPERASRTASAAAPVQR